jgi:predicted Zn-dependent protease
MVSRLRRFLVAVLLAASPLAAYAGGDFGSVRIHDDEQNLIDSSKQLHNYFEAHALLYNDDKVLGLVRRIGHEIRPMPSDDYVEYEFYVLRDPSPNAFALPNGHVYVNTGMLARLADEDQLAAVLAHEISHVAGHHGII